VSDTFSKKSLKEKEVKFRNDIIRGPGGAQILCEDPSGNLDTILLLSNIPMGPVLIFN